MTWIFTFLHAMASQSQAGQCFAISTVQARKQRSSGRLLLSPHASIRTRRACRCLTDAESVPHSDRLSSASVKPGHRTRHSQAEDQQTPGRSRSGEILTIQNLLLLLSRCMCSIEPKASFYHTEYSAISGWQHALRSESTCHIRNAGQAASHTPEYVTDLH